MTNNNSLLSEEPAFQRELGTGHFVPNQTAINESDRSANKGAVIAQTFKNTQKRIKEAADQAQKSGDMAALKDANSNMRDLYTKVSNHFNLPIGPDSFDKAMTALERRDAVLANVKNSDNGFESAKLNEYKGKVDERTNSIKKGVAKMRQDASKTIEGVSNNVGTMSMLAEKPKEDATTPVEDALNEDANTVEDDGTHNIE